jgi:hypothetical protein
MIYKLFKYRPININTLDSINNHYFYFSKAPNLNDPFDCRVNIQSLTNQENVKKWMLLHNNEAEISELEDSISGGFKIFSQSKVNNNILMWSHYADSHQGVCLEYTINYSKNKMCFKVEPFRTENHNSYNVHNEDLLYISEVRYSKDIPVDDSDELLFDSLITKGVDWAYEKEYRILMHDTFLKSQKIVYKKECLSGMIFGCRALDSNKELIMTIVNNVYPKNSVRFYDAKIVKNKYKLEIIPIEATQ